MQSPESCFSRHRLTDLLSTDVPLTDEVLKCGKTKNGLTTHVSSDCYSRQYVGLQARPEMRGRSIARLPCHCFLLQIGLTIKFHRYLACQATTFSSTRAVNGLSHLAWRGLWCGLSLKPRYGSWFILHTSKMAWLKFYITPSETTPG